MSQTVLVFGGWHLGSVIGSCLAEFGHHVALWDQNEAVRASWAAGRPPLFEPGLTELAMKNWTGKLHWAHDLKKAAPTCDWIIFAYDLPVNDQDEVDAAVLYEGLHLLLDSDLKEDAGILITSQVRVGESRKIQQLLQERFPKWKGRVVYSPENLRLGDAIQCMKTPDRVVLGFDFVNEEERKTWAKRFVDLYQIPETPLNLMRLESAEFVKHALNSFLATCVVFANEVSDLCENSGADAWEVMASLKQDSRVGPKAFLRPGLGFAGATLARDVKTLMDLQRRLETKDQKGRHDFFSQVYSTNSLRNNWVVNNLKKELGSLRGKKIVLLGVTYKPGTSTVRRSSAIDIGHLLFAEGASLLAVDPMADLKEMSPDEFLKIPFEIIREAGPALSGADAVVLVTAWPQFKEIDWAKFSPQMRTRLILDTQSFLPNSAAVACRVLVPGRVAATTAY